MSDYSKYLTPFWVQREKEIEGSVKFEEDGSCDIFNNPYIAHAMISGDGWINTCMRMLVHLHAWQGHTGIRIQDVHSIIEFGAGFGGMAKQIGFVNTAPYTILDLPVMNKIQKHFLKNEPQVSYVPMSEFDGAADKLSCDLFISTYALGETSEACINEVMGRGFFNAKHVMFVFGRECDTTFPIDGPLKHLKKMKGFGEYDGGAYRIFN
jgi:hypothetical protein